MHFGRFYYEKIRYEWIADKISVILLIHINFQELASIFLECYEVSIYAMKSIVMGW